nr:MAG TPA: hypothetical protein [Caudoviricetes sp.]
MTATTNLTSLLSKYIIPERKQFFVYLFISSFLYNKGINFVED